jgi:4-alpha-glucanotransferase
MKKKRQEAHPDSVLLALRALGADVKDPADVSGALRQRRDELRKRGSEPVIVAWDGRVDLKSRKLPNSSKSTLVLEDGTTERWPPRKALPPGYHHLHTQSAQGRAESLVISAPIRAYFPFAEKVSGVFAPLYALHSDRSRDAGDLTDMQTLIDWTAQRGGRVVSTLPLLANYLDRPFEPSPYSPISRLFWNEFYIDPSRAPEFSASPEAQAHLRRSEGRTSKLVDYRTTMEKKRRVLEVLARCFFERTAGQDVTPSSNSLITIRKFSLTQNFGQRRTPRRVVGTIGEETPPSASKHLEHYHLYAQWLVQHQLSNLEMYSRAKDCMLYLDLPLGLHRDSFDTWKYPHLFVKGMSGGAPPIRSSRPVRIGLFNRCILK